MDRNLIYRGNEIKAFTALDGNGKKQIYCVLKRYNGKILNLGECNDGGKFTSVNQAVNQAKQYIDTCIEYNW